MTAEVWTVTVVVGGANVSADVTGSLQVVAEENQARTARVSYASSGSYVPEDLVGANVTIDLVSVSGGGGAGRLFTGQCNWPRIDTDTGVITLECSDMLQTHFEGLDDSQILATIPGAVLADEVFGEREDGWQRTQDALSTVRGEVHKDAGGNVVFSPWAAGAADASYGPGDYLYRTPRATFAEHRQIVNSISVNYQYRYSRFKIREHSYGWTGWSSNFGGTTFCNWKDDGYPLLPKKSQLEDAARGAGWPLAGGISSGRLPGPGVYYCDGNPIIWLGVREEDGTPSDSTAQDEGNDTLVTGAGWITRKRFAQVISEDYTLTVASSGSIALFGTLPGEDGGSADDQADNAAWESSEDTAIPGSFQQDAIGDWIEDQGDRAIGDNLVRCLLQIADAKIAGSHRLNFVEWTVPCDPGLDLDDVAQISAPNVSATGKIVQLQHTLDTGTGQALTAVKIACSRGGGGTTDPLDPPAIPNTDPTHQAPPASTSLNTYVGGEFDSPDWNEAARAGESYVSTNVQAQSASRPEQYYPRRVQVVGPDIEQEARDNLDAPQAQAYNVGIPDDPLSVTIQ